MIADIKRELTTHGPLSLRELAICLKMSPDALEPLLQLLVRKGRVTLLPISCGASCKGCSCSNREDLLIFQWNQA